MKNQFLTILLLASTLLPIVGCNKYPEGPGMSLKSKANRIEGTYQATTFTCNGADLLSWYTSASVWTSCSTYLDYADGYDTKSYEWVFTKGGSVSTSQTIENRDLDVPSSSSTCSIQYNYSTSTTIDAGTWTLVHDKEQMQLRFGTTTVDADILELRDKQIKLRWFDNSGTTVYNITLEEQ